MTPSVILPAAKPKLFGRNGEFAAPFAGFEPLNASFLYCPNQFFDVCLRHSSRGVVRLIAYLLLRTIGWLDHNGNPVEQEIQVSYREFISGAGVSRGAVREAITEAVRCGFIVCIQPGRANRSDEAAQSATFVLRWDTSGRYAKGLEAFQGFYAGEGHRTPIPKSYFERVVRQESLAVSKVVGAVLRHTVGYQNQFGGRRSQAPLSYSYMQTFAAMHDRSTLAAAVHRAMAVGYIQCVERGKFDPRQSRRKAASYAVRWLDAAHAQFKNPTSSETTVQKPDQPQFKNPTSDDPKARPVEQSRNPTEETAQSKESFKQQTEGGNSAVAVVNEKGLALLCAAGFDRKIATSLSRSVSFEQIEQQIGWLARRNPQRNRLGMLRRAIEENWPKPSGLEDGTIARQGIDGSESREEVLASLGREQKEKQRLRAMRLSMWRDLSPKQQADWFERAANGATNRFTTLRLHTHRDFTNPPSEVLAVMAAELESRKQNS